MAAVVWHTLTEWMKVCWLLNGQCLLIMVYIIGSSKSWLTIDHGVPQCLSGLLVLIRTFFSRRYACAKCCLLTVLLMSGLAIHLKNSSTWTPVDQLLISLSWTTTFKANLYWREIYFQSSIWPSIFVYGQAALNSFPLSHSVQYWSEVIDQTLSSAAIFLTQRRVTLNYINWSACLHVTDLHDLVKSRSHAFRSGCS